MHDCVNFVQSYVGKNLILFAKPDKSKWLSLNVSYSLI